jgi:iron complex transport system substrate-binding protein
VRALSFLPAATRTIVDLGLADLLYGVTFECPIDRPRIVRSKLEGRTLDSAEIDRVVSDAARRGETLYTIDEELLRAAEPDVIFTQHVCDVCQIGTAVVERAVARLPRAPQIVPLVPRRFADVVENTRTVAAALGQPQAAEALVARAQARIDAIPRRPPVRAMVLEWIEPPYNCGHWIPDQIERAGGVDELANPGGYSTPIEWARVRDYDPEVLVIAPCGFDVARAERELAPYADRLAGLRARTYIADAHLFTQPSLTTLVEGIELLASLFHDGAAPASSSASRIR